MRASPGRVSIVAVISVPAAILVVALVFAALGRQLSVLAFVTTLLVVSTFWILVARFRKRPKPAPEPPRIAWHLQHSDADTAALLGLSFVDAARGWAVGGSGTVLATTDGGETWSALDSGGTVELNAVAFSDPQHGFMVGNNEDGQGTILATTDGGGTWSEQTTSASLLSDITFPDATHGWAVGGDSTILATADRGETWHQQRSGGTESLLGVNFADATHGWAVGVDNERNAGIVLTTTDGGNTWTARRPRGSKPLRAVSFADIMHGWAVGDAGTVLVTADGGKTWKPQTLGGPRSGQFVPTLHAVTFPDTMHGWAVGYDDQADRGLILTTIDGGGTWFKTPGRGCLYALAFPDATHGWAVGSEEASEGDTETALILAAVEHDDE
mgnify:FL=1